MSTSLLFGALLIVWGISQIMGALFNIHIPVFGIIFGLFLLYMGIQMIVGFSRWPEQCCSSCSQSYGHYTTCMGSSKYVINNDSLKTIQSSIRCSTNMGENIIDMTSLTREALAEKGSQLTVYADTVFGKTTIRLNKDIPGRDFFSAVQCFGRFATLCVIP